MKTKDLRKKLINAIDKIERGELSPSDGRNIVGMANQVNLSIQSELKMMKLQVDTGKQVSALGNMNIT